MDTHKLDDTVEDSFPASDPPSHTPVAGTRRAEQQGRAEQPEGYGEHETGRPGDGDHRTPTGLPSDDRHAAETTAARIEGKDVPEQSQR